MKATHATAIALIALLSANQANAQPGVSSPSDLPAATARVPIPETVATAAKDNCGCKGSKSGKDGPVCSYRVIDSAATMCEGEPWSLWSSLAPNLAENSCISVGGWTQIGYYTEGTNGDGTGMFNNNPNTVQLHQAWAWLEKPIDADRCDAWDWGFRMDYVYGTDGQDTQAFGGRPNDWDNRWDNGGYYGSAIPQLYFQVAYNDLTITAGHFYTICGYEVVQAPDNFFYSHAFTMVNAEPFTHTGVLAEYAVNDNLTVWGGYTAGWDTGFTRNYGDTYLGGVRLQLLENVAATYTLTGGDFGFGAFGSDETAYSHSVVVETTLTDRLTYVFQTDYLDNDILMWGPGVIDKAWGINNYLLYSVNDCVGVGGRYEFYDDERFGGDVSALTIGMNIRPHANVTLRPEVRWEDWSASASRNDSTMFGMDMIVTF